jgi:hypothetical protein
MSGEYFKDRLAPVFDEKLCENIKKICPHVFLVCFRSKNKNVVVYQANCKDGKFLNPPILSYWLILEPKYQDATRTHDREELNCIERNMIYKMNFKRVSDTECDCFFYQSPEFKFKLKSLDCQSKLFMKHKEQQYYLKSAYVKSSENMFLFPLSRNVESIYITGCNMNQKPLKYEKIVIK